ncbi:hypothetical protein BDW59DRAFT_174895 [Aspergillus cavernicola]|uniref:General substrate transporter n=1 Tax=Aspergillus cavernicola TaxID=176166 RepID=A0ABR4HUY1_9EURO
MSSSAFMGGLRGRSLTLAQLALVVCPAYVLFGYNQSNLGGLVSLSDWVARFPCIDTATTTTGAQNSDNATIQGVVIASFTLGALPGCLSCSYTSEKLGRRPVIFLGSAFQLAQLVIGRSILGVGVGMLSGTVPTWQSECSSSKNRGKHIFKTGPVTWRPPVALPCFLSLVLMLSIFFMPESPRWLAPQNRFGEAQNSLSALKALSINSPKVTAEIASIEASLEQTANSAAGLRDLFSMGEGRLLYLFSICILLQFYQQMAGGNLISVYSTVIFQDGLNLGAQTSRILSGGTLTRKLISCFMSFFTIDRLGRRFAFMVSGTGMAACMMGLAIATSFPHSNYAAQMISVLFIFMFNFFLPIGANFLYLPRNFVVTMITPVAIRPIGYKYYIVYTCIGFCIPFSI